MFLMAAVMKSCQKVLQETQTHCEGREWPWPDRELFRQRVEEALLETVTFDKDPEEAVKCVSIQRKVDGKEQSRVMIQVPRERGL